MDSNTQIVRPVDVLPEMLHRLRNGLEKGSSTGISAIDNCWRWRRSEVNVWSGYSNEGKSLFLRNLMLIKVLVDGWTFLVSAPEDWPCSEFFDDIIHTLVGQSTDRDNINCVSEEKYLRAYNLIKDHFIFVYLKPPDNTVEKALNIFGPLIDETGAQAIVIDPLVKFARPAGVPERDDLYAGYLTTMWVDFARNYNVSAHVVIHQTTPQANQETGLYPEPSMYKVRGGGVYADGVDNVLFVQRPMYAKDKMDTLVTFGSQKIKRQKLVGIPQKLNLRFDRRANRYTTEDNRPIFDFDKYLR